MWVNRSGTVAGGDADGWRAAEHKPQPARLAGATPGHDQIGARKVLRRNGTASGGLADMTRTAMPARAPRTVPCRRPVSLTGLHPGSIGRNLIRFQSADLWKALDVGPVLFGVHFRTLRGQLPAQAKVPPVTRHPWVTGVGHTLPT